MWYVFFNAFILAMLLLDLVILNRKSHVVGIREALLWTAFWVLLALGFNVWIFFGMGRQPALEFLTGYLIEESLSVDNLFVFLVIFSYFRVAPEHQHKVLFWGILGALVMRALFIFAGISLINRFEWIIYVFGLFLIYTGYKLAVGGNEQVHPEKNPVIRLVRRVLPVTPKYMGNRFFVRENGRLSATPLFIVLCIVETTDVVFAVDSIPAILSITRDPFIVYTSNAFAILGLRSLYFALSGMMQIFHFLHYGLSAILGFVGVKMLIHHYYVIPVHWALVAVGGILLVSVLVSVMFPQKEKHLEPVQETNSDSITKDPS